jgi:hypothetical protein
MAQKKLLYKEKLKQTGYWTYKELYHAVFHWLREHNYKIFEELYNEKLKSNGKEVIIKWRCERKITDYFKYQQRIDWHIIGMKDADVEIDGKKISTQKGEVEIIFIAELIKDYERRWEDKPFWKFLRSVYEKYVVRETLEQYEDEVRDELKEMITEIKSFLRIPGR